MWGNFDNSNYYNAIIWAKAKGWQEHYSKMGLSDSKLREVLWRRKKEGKTPPHLKGKIIKIVVSAIGKQKEIHYKTL